MKSEEERQLYFNYQKDLLKLKKEKLKEYISNHMGYLDRYLNGDTIMDVTVLKNELKDIQKYIDEIAMIQEYVDGFEF